VHLSLLPRRLLPRTSPLSLVFLFTAPPTTAIYTLSLHDALPIFRRRRDLLEHRRLHPSDRVAQRPDPLRAGRTGHDDRVQLQRRDRKSTRLNSSHVKISYAVFCLKKKKRQATARTDSAEGCRRAP